MTEVRSDPWAQAIRLWDIVKLFLGSSLATFLVMALVSAVHGSRFDAIMAALSVGNCWYLARYEWLSSRCGWADLRQRFAPISHRVLLGCAAGGALLVLAFTGFEKMLELGGIKLASIPSPPFVTSDFSQLPAAFMAIVIIGPLGEELLFRGLLLDWLRVRMPTWGAGVIITMVGIGLAIGNWISVVVSVGCLSIAVAVRIRVEEAALAAHFGGDYPAHKARTWAILPFVW